MGYRIRHVLHSLGKHVGLGQLTALADDFYSVTELGNDLGVSARTIRFYEVKGLIAPSRAGNNRVYTARDRARMILILRGKKLGFSLREIGEYLDLYDVDPTHAKQIRLLLEAVHSKIVSLEEQRVALDQSLLELRAVEAQALSALSTLENGARKATARILMEKVHE